MTSSQNILTLIHEVAILFPVFLIIFSLRGFFCASLARLFGDETARDRGFLTLNPLIHVRTVTLLFMFIFLCVIATILNHSLQRVVILFLFFGLKASWVNSTAVNLRNTLHPRMYTITYAFSSSLSLFAIAFLGLVCVKCMGLFSLPNFMFKTCAELLQALITTTLLYGALDMIPLPPMHARILLYPITPSRWHYVIDFLQEHAFFVLAFVCVVPGVRNIFWATITVIQILVKMFFTSLLF